MVTKMPRRFVRTLSFNLGVWLLGLLLGPLAGMVALSHAVSETTPIPKNSAMNRSAAGAKTGMLKMMSETTAQIDTASYPLAPGMIVETPSGRSLAQAPGWQKRLPSPVFVQYWVGKTGITQMIVFVHEQKPRGQ